MYVCVYMCMCVRVCACVHKCICVCTHYVVSVTVHYAYGSTNNMGLYIQYIQDCLEGKISSIS